MMTGTGQMHTFATWRKLRTPTRLLAIIGKSFEGVLIRPEIRRNMSLGF
jgi:hypothetical protein